MSAINREISDSNLETGRNGSKPGASRIIWESLQPCYIHVLEWCNWFFDFLVSELFEIIKRPIVPPPTLPPLPPKYVKE